MLAPAFRQAVRRIAVTPGMLEFAQRIGMVAPDARTNDSVIPIGYEQHGMSATCPEKISQNSRFDVLLLDLRGVLTTFR